MDSKNNYPLTPYMHSIDVNSNEIESKDVFFIQNKRYHEILYDSLSSGFLLDNHLTKTGDFKSILYVVSRKLYIQNAMQYKDVMCNKGTGKKGNRCCLSCRIA